MKALSLVLPALLWAGAIAAARASDSGPPAKAVDPDVPPFANLLAFAEARKIPVSGVSVPSPRSAARPGDRLTYFLSLHDHSGVHQWLIDLSEAALSATQLATPPPAIQMVYSSIGGKYAIPSAWAAENVRIAGPFGDQLAEAPEVAEKSSGFLVHENYLSFGLDRSAAYLLKMAAALKTGRECRRLAWAGYSPYPAAEVPAAQAEAKAAGISPAEGEAYAKALPALLEFFHIAERTPGLKEVILQILARPSLWSIIRSGGVNVTFSLDVFGAAEMAPHGRFIRTPIYLLPFDFQLNGQTALKCEMMVTEPGAPLATGAGILELIAVSPKDPDTYLVLRLLSANRNPEIGAKSP